MKTSPKKHYQAGMLPILFVAFGLVIWKTGGINAHGWGDYVMFGAVMALLVWFLLPSRADKSTGHQGPTQ
jgi:hypothetical protein